jgi:hypothetical protein
MDDNVVINWSQLTRVTHGQLWKLMSEGEGAELESRWFGIVWQLWSPKSANFFYNFISTYIFSIGLPDAESSLPPFTFFLYLLGIGLPNTKH